MELEEKIMAISADVKGLSDEIGSLHVTDEPTARQATTFLGAIKMRYKRIEELRKFFVNPLNDQVKAINNKFKLQTEPLQQLEEKIKDELAKYMDEKERIANEEAERRRKEQEEKERLIMDMRKRAKEADEKKRKEMEAEAKRLEQEAAATELVEAPARNIRTETGVMSQKKVWKWEVVNEDLLRKARPDLFIVDVKAIMKLVQNGERVIPGIRIYQKSEIAMHT